MGNRPGHPEVLALGVVHAVFGQKPARRFRAHEFGARLLVESAPPQRWLSQVGWSEGRQPPPTPTRTVTRLTVRAGDYLSDIRTLDHPQLDPNVVARGGRIPS